ncbi:MAG TPA: Uma2 family endonuclease [Gemmataceae bacterium]|nr:Uma2 family endonuclease [Gemmataceae bacterium]
MTKLAAPAPVQTIADLLKRLGDIPPERVRARPYPGTATEQDVIDIEAREGRLCELVDGVLVEKTVGYYEARLATILGYFLEHFLGEHDLGIVLGADGTLRLMPGLVRIPDVCFTSWRKFPQRELPAEPIPDLVPDLAVEVLSEGNTEAEMRRKLGEYFRAGVRLVWLIDPATRTARVHRSPTKKATVPADGTLVGGPVLPGFSLPLTTLFARAGKQARREQKLRQKNNGKK